MAIQKAPINGEVLRWAREQAQLELEAAAGKAGITSTKNKTAARRLEEWETGTDLPTPNQLAALAKQYCRPPLTFYLKEPPRPTTGVADFRTVGDRGATEASTRLRALVAQTQARQKEVIGLLLDEDENREPLRFIGKFTAKDTPAAVAADIQNSVGIARRRANDRTAKFRELRIRIEELGVYVLLQGDLGSSHTDIEPEEFRGFVLSDAYAPFIVLNDNDAEAARLFTLIHELAHLWIGESGISNVNPFADTSHQHGVERFCNAVAAEFLMPADTFLSDWEIRKDRNVEWVVEELASIYGVSRAAAAFRLRVFRKITEDDWWRLYRMYQAGWQRNREQQRATEGGPTYPTLRKFSLGGRLIRTVLGALDAGELSHTRASRILGTTSKNFDRLRARGM